MKKQLLVSVGLAILLCGCSQQETVKPASGIPKAHQATYSSPDNFAYKKQDLYSDGVALVRMDISGDSMTPAIVSVYDAKKDEVTMWALGTKKFTRRPAQPMDPLVMWVRMGRLSGANATALGVRRINGHECHGYRGELGSEVWMDEDYGYPVESTAGGIKTVLAKFTPGAPDPSVFEPPAGYERVGTRTRARKRSAH